MSGISVSQLAYYLAFIGGILMLLFGLLGFLGSFGDFYFHWGFAYGGIVTIIMGVIAIIGAKSANTLVWAIVLIIVGAIGGGLGGLLVFLGGLVGLIVVLTKEINLFGNSLQGLHNLSSSPFFLNQSHIAKPKISYCYSTW